PYLARGLDAPGLFLHGPVGDARTDRDRRGVGSAVAEPGMSDKALQPRHLGHDLRGKPSTGWNPRQHDQGTALLAPDLVENRLRRPKIERAWLHRNQNRCGYLQRRPAIRTDAGRRV